MDTALTTINRRYRGMKNTVGCHGEVIEDPDGNKFLALSGCLITPATSSNKPARQEFFLVYAKAYKETGAVMIFTAANVEAISTATQRKLNLREFELYQKLKK